MAPENNPLEREIPIGNHHFKGRTVSFRECIPSHFFWDLFRSGDFLILLNIWNNFLRMPDDPVPIFKTKLPVANISGNDRPLFVAIYRELEDEGIKGQLGVPKINSVPMVFIVFSREFW